MDFAVASVIFIGLQSTTEEVTVQGHASACSGLLIDHQGPEARDYAGSVFYYPYPNQEIDPSPLSMSHECLQAVSVAHNK